MEIRESRIDTENKIISLLRKYIPSKEIKLEDELEWDLGLTGDDALDFITEFGSLFNVDISNFQFGEYFYDEVYYFIFKFNNFWGIRKKKRITLNNLIDAVQSLCLR